jgi:hypothetical protein
MGTSPGAPRASPTGTTCARCRSATCAWRSACRADIFLGPAGKRGVVVFALPRSVVTGASVKDLTTVVVRSFGSGSGLLPGLRLGSDQENIFMNFTSPRFQRWTYSGGSLNAGAGISPQGRLYIAMAWGPGDDTLQTQIVNSFSQLF